MLQVEDNRIRLLSLFAKVVPIRNVGCGMNNIRRQVLMRILWHSGKEVIQYCTESDDEGLLKKKDIPEAFCVLHARLTTTTIELLRYVNEWSFG